MLISFCYIGVWCNGSIRALGACSPGSNPGTPTNENKNMKENFGLSIPEERIDETRQKRKEEYEKSVESTASWLLGILETNKEYKEKIPLTKERNIVLPDFVKNIGGAHVDGSFPLIVQYAKSMTLSQKGLYELARDISSRYQELRFTFKIDPKGEWIEFSVCKQIFNIGDEVFWEPEETPQWDKPKKISSIQEDPNSKKKFAFFEGSHTGIPLEQLVQIKK